MKESRCLQVAKDIILTYLGAKETPDGLYDIYEIKHGNKDVLLQHLKALDSIFQSAIKEIEGENK